MGRLNKMVAFILNNPRPKTSDFVKEFDLSSRTIKSNLDILKKLGIIAYTGSAKTGYYEIKPDFLSKFKSEK